MVEVTVGVQVIVMVAVGLSVAVGVPVCVGVGVGPQEPVTVKVVVLEDTTWDPSDETAAMFTTGLLQTVPHHWIGVGWPITVAATDQERMGGPPDNAGEDPTNEMFAGSVSVTTGLATGPGAISIRLS
jgi:hypothetical protein